MNTDAPQEGVTSSPTVSVFMPSPILTITIERFSGEQDEHHIHAGGQGFWVARMVRGLGVDVSLSAPLGGDTGAVLAHLIEAEGVELRSVHVRLANGSYIHDRRGGERVVISEVQSGRLSRHEMDDFYDASLIAALDASVVVFTGPTPENVVPVDIYTRLARDARANGIQVVADLSGDALLAALEGGVDVLKISHTEAADAGFATTCDRPDLIRAVDRLSKAGARNVLITCAAEPAVALVDGEHWEVRVPRLEPVDFRGAGDSTTAGIAVGLARGYDVLRAIRLGVGAGALNVTRHGLGTGEREHVQRISRLVRLVQLQPDDLREIADNPG